MCGLNKMNNQYRQYKLDYNLTNFQIHLNITANSKILLLKWKQIWICKQIQLDLLLIIGSY